uniref:hypothetical protein n=1 Tax=Candidatus Enterococcus willemsii TaxID=1857215 RepID=UPI00403FC0A6
MEFDECVYHLYDLARTDDEELAARFHSLASSVSKNGITGLVPIADGGITDGVPFSEILSTLQIGLEQATFPSDRQHIEALYDELVSTGIDGYVASGK